MMRFVCSIALCVGVGCGGGSGTSGGDPGGVTGTVNGVSFSIEDAISASITQSVLGQTNSAAYIWLSNSPDICGDIQTNRERPSSQRVLVEVVDANGSMSATPTGPGTYPVNASTGTTAGALSTADFDASCQQIAAGTATATAGTVTLTAVNGDVFAGTFDVTLDSGDHLTGSFNPTACPDLQMVFNPLYGARCM